MQIRRNTNETSPGPADRFTGSVFIDTIAAPGEASSVGAAAVLFTPGAHKAWHTHPLGQTIWVTEGSASASAKAARSRSSVQATASSSSPARTTGTGPRRFMTHVAIQQADGSGNPVEWGRNVTEEEYGRAPAVDAGDS